MTAPPWARAHLRPGEEALWWARPSLFGLVPIVLSTLAAGAGVAVSAYYGYERPGLLTGAPALALAVGGLLLELGRRALRLGFTSYVVTTERVYAITSFLATDVRSVPLSRVSRVVVRQGLAGRALGLWTATVSGYGEARQSLRIPAIRDGRGLLDHASGGMARAANADWLVRGD